MLAGTADRERAVDVIRAGLTEGRLTQDEFTDRVARAYASRTYGDLGQLTADLPAGPVPYPPGVAARLSSAPAAEWRPAAVGERMAASVAGLVLTAAIVFAVAVLLTTLAVLLHHGPPGFAQVPYTHTLPYVRHLG
jgi:hypothetical protein